MFIVKLYLLGDQDDEAEDDISQITDAEIKKIFLNF